MSDDIKPKGCPWCPAPPKVRKHELHGDTAWYVLCVNEDCELQPGTVSYRSRRQAIAAWNQRPVEQQKTAPEGDIK